MSEQTEFDKRCKDAMASDCAHFKAEATGTTEARQLRDGRWEYRSAFACPCGIHFVELHIGGRIDDAQNEVRALRSMLIAPNPPQDSA